MPSTTPLIDVLRLDGPVVQGSYIVKLKDGVVKDNHLVWVTGQLCAESQITADWEAFNGYAGKFSEATLNALRASRDIEYIEEDGVVEECARTTQKDAPWGLERICENKKLKRQDDTKVNFSYTYNTKAGQNVDIYVVDSGIYTEHTDYGGRAKWGKTFLGTDKVDGTGHGTLCSGVAGGTRWGVAKKVTLIAVKVIRDEGGGTNSALLSGLLWVKDQALSTKRPLIASVSLSGAKSKATNDTVKILTDAGVHVVVAAGNQDKDASNVSPASAPTALAVGATTIADLRWSKSNYGRVVRMWAPGHNITTCSKYTKTSTDRVSGTSVACPHVSGLIAYFISVYGNMAPKAMIAKVQALSLKNEISGLPPDTPNELLRNDE